MERIVKFNPAFDRRTEPGNGGVGGVEILFVVKGTEGAVEWKLLTEWMLPEVEHYYEQLARKNPFLYRAPYAKLTSAPVYGHFPSPLSPDVERSKDVCPWLAAPCYQMKISGFTEVRDIELALKRQGDNGLWTMLEEYYKHLENLAEYYRAARPVEA